MTIPADPTAALTLHVLHTNDFHGALSDDGAGRLREFLAGLNGEPHVLLDAGDAIKAGNVGVNPFGEPILDRMSDLGYRAMTMGNREFHVWQAALETKIGRARFPVLCANVRARREGAELPVQDSVVFEVGGLNVAVFGVTVPMVTERMAVKAMSSFVFDDPVETAQKMVTRLRYHADVLIALTHTGLREDQRLARTVRGIDLLVGGHSHVTLAEPEVVGGTPIVQTGSHGRAFGHVKLRISRDGVKVESAVLHPLEDKPARRRAAA